MGLESGVFAALTLGFLLGLKHATDADHVVAVSTIVGRERNLWRSLWIGISWGAGHSTPLIVLGFVILLLKDTVLSLYESVAPVFEFGVGIMLVYLGINVVWNILRRNVHVHHHTHGDQSHVHIHTSHTPSNEDGDTENHHGLLRLGKPMFRARSYTIALMHGLAGSAAVMLTLLPTIASMKLGHPVPDLNFSDESNNFDPHPAHVNIPSPSVFRCIPLNGASVPLSLKM